MSKLISSSDENLKEILVSFQETLKIFIKEEVERQFEERLRNIEKESTDSVMEKKGNEIDGYKNFDNIITDEGNSNFQSVVDENANQDFNLDNDNIPKPSVFNDSFQSDDSAILLQEKEGGENLLKQDKEKNEVVGIDSQKLNTSSDFAIESPDMNINIDNNLNDQHLDDSNNSGIGQAGFSNNILDNQVNNITEAYDQSLNNNNNTDNLLDQNPIIQDKEVVESINLNSQTLDQNQQVSGDFGKAEDLLNNVINKNWKKTN